jgi:hypothetical protein
MFGRGVAVYGAGHEVAGVVSRAVVEDEELEVLPALRQQALERLVEKHSPIVGRHSDGHPFHARGPCPTNSRATVRLT